MSVNKVTKKPSHPEVKKTATTKKTSTAKKTPAIDKAFTKLQIIQAVAEYADIKSIEAKNALDGLAHVIERHLKKGAIGIFTLPGLFKCQLVHKPAIKAHQGINPFTKEETVFKAKPAHHVIKIKPLKKLKDMV